MSKDNADFFNEKSEWARIKDSLLSYYLKPYAAKILHTGRPLVYVDGFAGPGKFKTGEIGSPLIACDELDAALSISNARNASVTKVFVELQHADLLRSNLASRGAHVYQRSFADLPEILDGLNIGGANLFLYVDPFGIKYLDMRLFGRFVRLCSSVEVLVNFNSFGFLREACRAYGMVLRDLPDGEELPERDPWDISVAADAVVRLDTIMGSREWRTVINCYKDGLLDGYEAECALADSYATGLKCSFRYVLNFPVRLKEGRRPKYRMFHASNHPDGTILMYQSMEKGKEFLQYMQAGGQTSLFEQDIENALVFESDIKQGMIENLGQNERPIRLNEFYASFMTETGITLPFEDIKNILKELERSGAVRITRDPSLTSANRPRTFMQETLGMKAWIGVT